MWAGAVEGLFTPMVIGVPNIDVEIAYTQRVSENSPLIIAGPILTRRGSNAYRVDFAVEHDGAPNALLGGGEVASRSFDLEDVPLTVAILGARIEILSVERNVVTYRVLSMFDHTAPIQIAYSGEMGGEDLSREGASVPRDR